MTSKEIETLAGTKEELVYKRYPVKIGTHTNRKKIKETEKEHLKLMVPDDTIK